MPDEVLLLDILPFQENLGAAEFIVLGLEIPDYSLLVSQYLIDVGHLVDSPVQSLDFSLQILAYPDLLIHLIGEALFGFRLFLELGLEGGEERLAEIRGYSMEDAVGVMDWVWEILVH